MLALLALWFRPMIICPISEVQIGIICTHTHSGEISVVLFDSETEAELLLPECIANWTLGMSMHRVRTDKKHKVGTKLVL